MGVYLYIIVGIIEGIIFSKKFKTSGGLFLYIIVGIIGSLIGGLLWTSFINSNIFYSSILSIIFALLILYIFKFVINKAE